MSPTKALVSGAFATGKTTLVRGLVNRFCQERINAVEIVDCARKCPFPLNRDQTLIASAWLIGEQIRSETAATRTNPHVILCDRGVPDILSHTFQNRPHQERQSTLLNIIQDLALAWSKTYDLVFWATIDPKNPIQEDELRITDKQYQADLQHSLRKAFSALRIAPVKLPRKTEDRIDTIIKRVVEWREHRT